MSRLSAFVCCFLLTLTAGGECVTDAVRRTQRGPGVALPRTRGSSRTVDPDPGSDDRKPSGSGPNLGEPVNAAETAGSDTVGSWVAAHFGEGAASCFGGDPNGAVSSLCRWFEDVVVG